MARSQQERSGDGLSLSQRLCVERPFPSRGTHQQQATRLRCRTEVVPKPPPRAPKVQFFAGDSICYAVTPLRKYGRKTELRPRCLRRWVADPSEDEIDLSVAQLSILLRYYRDLRHVNGDARISAAESSINRCK